MKFIRRIKQKIKFWWQRRTRGWSDDETWNIDFAFIKWLREHLKVYLEEAGKYIDLEYHTFEYKGKTYTQLQLIKELIKLTEKYEKTDILDNNIKKTKKAIFELFDILFFSLWW